MLKSIYFDSYCSALITALKKNYVYITIYFIVCNCLCNCFCPVTEVEQHQPNYIDLSIFSNPID